MTACVRQRLESLMRSVGSTHHDPLVERDASDHRWATWYAGHLQAPVSELIGRTITRADLEKLLVGAETERQWVDPFADWPSYYADYFARRA